MQVGMIGAGRVSQALARYVLQASHSVILSSRHGPESLADRVRELGEGATAGTVEEAAHAPIVLLAVPWTQIAPALSGLPPWEGRILIDATNHFVQAEPQPLLAELGGRVSSEMVAELAPGARVVKGLNTLTMEHFEAGPRQGAGRRVIFLSGDESAKREVAALFSSFGFVIIDLGDLHTGGLEQQVGGPLAGRDLVQLS